MAGTPPRLDAHTVVLLRRPPDAPELPEEELDRLQEQHLAHLHAMRERGALLVAGPFGDQPDQTLRGLCVYAVGVEEARALAQRDPAVRAGRMVAEVFTWYAARGEVRFARTPTPT